MQIAVLPLDDRPVNAGLPGMVAAIAGATTEVPPDALLPRMREPGDPDGLARWTESAAGRVDALVVSLDMLGYGGLIASRTSADGLDAVCRRLATLERIRADRPDLPISGVTTVMRASNSYSSGEEPLYWADHGRELHRLGGALHRGFLGEPDDGALAGIRADVPPDVRRDFLGRRLRNHAVDLYCLGLANAGVVEPMLVTADDTAERAAGSLEQVWLRHWSAALELDRTVLTYPGADEVCAALTARALIAGDAAPRIAVVFAEPDGGARVAPFENVPVATTVANQVRAAGGVLVEEPDQAEAVLLVHAPDREPGDLTKAPAGGQPDAAAEAVLARLSDHAADRVLGLADVRWANGSDAGLVDRLVSTGLVERLAAYGGWNTAGNTIGSVVAALVAGVLGRRRATHDATAERQLLLHRLLEDYGYQAVVRGELTRRPEYAGHQSRPFEDAETGPAYLAAARTGLTETLAGLGPVADGWRLADAALPWNRTFEIDLDLRRS